MGVMEILNTCQVPWKQRETVTKSLSGQPGGGDKEEQGTPRQGNEAQPSGLEQGPGPLSRVWTSFRRQRGPLEAFIWGQ